MDREVMRVSVSTLGCKSNQYDSYAILDLFSANNFEVVGPSESADACVVNTCTVTTRTNTQSRQLIRKLKRHNPNALIIVTGCYAQVSPNEVSDIDGVDYVVGNEDRKRIVSHLLKERGDSNFAQGVFNDDEVSPFSLRASGASGKTRAFVKIQDGCNNSCAYCIIPKARGRAKSLPLNSLIEDVEGLIDKGYKEIVFTGIHLGSYGLDLEPALDMAGMLRIMDNKGYPCRFRISSLDPEEVTDELIDLIGSAETICNHLHLPLQSGDDSIIRKMNRACTASFFTDRARKALDKIPDLAIGIDVIAGFPGECEAEFLNTVKVINDLPIAYMHVFPFSRRPGTMADSMPGQVDNKVIKERCNRLRLLDKEKRSGFYKDFLGREVSVIVEGRGNKDTGFLRGRSRNYLPVLLNGDDNIVNHEVLVNLEEVTDDGVIGSIV